MDEIEPVETLQRHVEIAESGLSTAWNFKNDDAHLDPSRWWFASSAFPMIAGTLGPVASAFSICALVTQWRQQPSSDGSIQNASYYPDPLWLTIVNAVQLAVAIVSNVFLLLNMTRRVRFSIAQPITITGWYISAVCLSALSATAAGPLNKALYSSDEFSWSQAFYYGIFAAILYFVDASLMVVTFWGASRDHYDKDFVLTPSQRTLMLQTILLLTYLLLGALIFSTIEDWDYLDAVYWANVTLFTVGFGDFAASTTLGRALLFPYALIGIISLGLVISSIRSLILERGKRRLDARMEEKNRYKMIKNMTKKGNDEILNPIQKTTGRLPDSGPVTPPPAELHRRKAEFELMRKIQDKSSTRRKWIAMAVSTGSWLLLWFVGATIFWKCEEPYQAWSYFDAVYFCFVSLTTIGYGDRTPISNAGKAFFVFWSLLALPTMTVLISNAGDTVVKLIRDATIRLGSITILPGEQNFTESMNHSACSLSHRRNFPTAGSDCRGSNIESTLGLRSLNGDIAKGEQPGESISQGFQGGNIFEAHNSACDNVGGASASIHRNFISTLRIALDDLPTGTDFHLLLVQEIQKVTGHLNGNQPRHYTYEEWAWYLRLLGEDEREPGTHLKVGVPKRRMAQTTQQIHDDEALTKWSWVGVHSPLMGSQEESEWILERLTAKLKDSLHTERNRARFSTSSLHSKSNAQKLDEKTTFAPQ